ncbi:hypothetical protein [Conexibacter sp. CPCC 206217]|uniref:hypothetical protein n=1 Tax=Conexibacter sp. CPCC 206217 TaxID=3064574 RepID=UPI002725DDE3|nr:hypothetical protein [Conexibacter sp. CPCC 206217]MDO8212226.1 hypothetical protein [Conexibacter sp. CPCC 206217]
MSGYPRPTQLTLHVEREAVDGRCGGCGGSGLERYPVLSEGGWFTVVKCPRCLASAARERWSRLGPIELLADTL